MTSRHAKEVARGERFRFGANWSRFLTLVDQTRISEAELSLMSMLNVSTLEGLSFLDVGSGSGLFSLAAYRLGARVHSFDYDPESVWCTRTLRRLHADDHHRWQVEEGSVLDRKYLARLGSFDVVYSWGVLHHTGAMWQAAENVAELVNDGGKLYIAVYNDQGWVSRYWHAVKRLYVKRPLLRFPIIAAHTPYPFFPALVSRTLAGGVRRDRGMSFSRDIIDWLGGLPFEVATPDAIVRFYEQRGFRLDRVVTTRRHGCNEFVFEKSQS